ncbi:hypothetical protein BH09VER1_BH09VER1_42170 [soil metagenome]
MQYLRQRGPVLLALAAFAISLWTLPAAWCRRGAQAWFAGDLATQRSLAQTVVAQVGHGLTTADFHSGDKLFDGEWLLGTHLMAGIGLCQIVQQHPESKAEFAPAIETCIQSLLSEDVRKFDRNAWQDDALETLDTDQGHAAYLGYVNFLLGLYRQIAPANQFTGLNDRITATLVRRFNASPTGLIATYPNQWYPVDNTPGLASIALHGQATGRDYSALLAREEAIFRSHLLDPVSGLLIQAFDGKGQPVDLGRGSGSALGAFFLTRAWPKLSGELFDSIRKNLATSLLGFGAIREYPNGISGVGDIDSGPIILGFGFSATGFSLAGARAFGDSALFARLYSSAILAGAPTTRGDRLDFLTAGPLGNAILLAMFTTPTLQ